MSLNICDVDISKYFSIIWQESLDKRRYFSYEEILESVKIFSFELTAILKNYPNQCSSIAFLSQHSPIIVPVIIG